MTTKELYCRRDEAKRLLEEAESIKLYNYSVEIIKDIVEKLIAQTKIQLPVNYQSISVDGNEIVAWHIMNSSNKGIYLLPDGRLVIYTPSDSDNKDSALTQGSIEEVQLVRIAKLQPDLNPSQKLIATLLGKLSHNNMLDNFGVRKDPRWYLTLSQLEARDRYNQQESLLAKQEKRSVICWVKRWWNEFRKII